MYNPGITISVPGTVYAANSKINVIDISTNGVKAVIFNVTTPWNTIAPDEGGVEGDIFRWTSGNYVLMMKIMTVNETGGTATFRLLSFARSSTNYFTTTHNLPLSAAPGSVLNYTFEVTNITSSPTSVRWIFGSQESTGTGIFDDWIEPEQLESFPPTAIVRNKNCWYEDWATGGACAIGQTIMNGEFISISGSLTVQAPAGKRENATLAVFVLVPNFWKTVSTSSPGGDEYVLSYIGGSRKDVSILSNLLATHLECVNNVCTRMSGIETDLCTNEGTQCGIENNIETIEFYFKTSKLVPEYYINSIKNIIHNHAFDVLFKLTTDYYVSDVKFDSNNYILTLVVKKVGSLSLSSNHDNTNCEIKTMPVIVPIIFIIDLFLAIVFAFLTYFGFWYTGKQETVIGEDVPTSRKITLKWKVHKSNDVSRNPVYEQVNADDIIKTSFTIDGKETILVPLTGKSEISFYVTYIKEFIVQITATSKNGTPYSVSNRGKITIPAGSAPYIDDTIIFKEIQPGIVEGPIKVPVNCTNTKLLITLVGSTVPVVSENLVCKADPCTKDEIVTVETYSGKMLLPGTYLIQTIPPYNSGCNPLTTYHVVNQGENKPPIIPPPSMCIDTKNKVSILVYYISKTPEVEYLEDCDIYVNDTKTTYTFDSIGKRYIIDKLEPNINYTIKISKTGYTFATNKKDVKFLLDDKCDDKTYCCRTEPLDFIANTPINTFDINIKVLDENTEKPIENAEVKIGSATRKTLTDGITNKSINGLAPGKYSGTITHDSYNDTPFDITVSKTETIPIKMKPIILQSELGKLETITHKIERSSIIGGDDEIIINVPYTNNSTTNKEYKVKLFDENEIEIEKSSCKLLIPNGTDIVLFNSNWKEWSLKSLGKKYIIKLYICEPNNIIRYVDSKIITFTLIELNPCCMEIPLIGCISNQTCKTVKQVAIAGGIVIIGYAAYKTFMSIKKIGK